MTNNHARICSLGAIHFIATLLTVNGAFRGRYDERPRIILKSPVSIGCFKDSQNTPDLSYVVKTSSNMLTIASCRSSCKELWYMYAALQNGDTCWCGNDYGKYGKVDYSECIQARCTGDQRQKCGGPLRNLIMWSDFYTEHSTRLNKCWKVDTSLGLATLVYTGTLGSHRLCKSICGAFRKTYAAALKGNQCWCSDKIFRRKLEEAKDCNEPCGGNPLENCGNDSDGMFVMHSVRDERDRGLLIAEGCYFDDIALPSTPLFSQVSDTSILGKYIYKKVGPFVFHTMTRDRCKQRCKELGCKLAGVKNGNECWCGTRFNTGVQLTDDYRCDVACAGNPEQTCGSARCMFVMDSGLEGQVPILV